MPNCHDLAFCVTRTMSEIFPENVRTKCRSLHLFPFRYYLYPDRTVTFARDRMLLLILANGSTKYSGKFVFSWHIAHERLGNM
jgi:hypothetical protein